MAMASSGTKRVESSGKIANLTASKGPFPIGFLCRNSASTYQSGSLQILDTFAVQYGDLIPNRVYLRVPNGSLWFGSYVHGTHRIEGLENFMRYYDVKPYQLLCVQYVGVADFLVEIFNCYAVEIDYGLKDIPLHNGSVCENNVGNLVSDFSELTEVDLDKLSSLLHYNGSSSMPVAYELLISDKHLKNESSTQVLNTEACVQLGLDDSITWIQFGFKTHRWNISLKWENGSAYFDHEWSKFATASKLRESDICLLLYTSHPQKFEIVIFDKLSIANFYRGGIEDGKGLLKFFKFMTYETVVTGELEIPRLFVEQFGMLLKENIKLYLGDGMEYQAYFLEGSNLLIDLKKLLAAYSVEENNVICFEFVGRSSFYVSVYNSSGMDIFNHKDKKLLLKDFLKGLEDGAIALTDRELDNIEGTTGLEVENLVQSVTGEHEIPIRKHRRLEQLKGVINYFTVVLKPSNVNQSGHGVYVARHLFRIYRSWNSYTMVNLIRRGECWKVGVCIKRRICRFGRGWDDFRKDNDLKEGDRVKFTHVSDKTFQVRVGVYV